MKRMIFSVLVTLAAGSAALLLGACNQTRSRAPAAEVHVDVTDKGFEPAEVKVPAGETVTLVMTRKTDQTCITEVEFASLHQNYKLPLNQLVRIALPASKTGTVDYQCGEHMFSGRVVVQ